MFAIAEFGSAVRGSSDANSDLDLLIVARRCLHFSLRRHYSAKGYSVTTLTPDQLSAMQRSGSLFIQHLKQESRIVFDVEGHFRYWLAQCSLVNPTKQEIRRCAATTGFFGGWPDDSRLTGWKADVLYCVSRDYLIKRLVTSGHIAFGLEDIEHAFQITAPSWSGDLRALKRLREAKAAYRSGRPVPGGTYNSIHAWVKNLAEWFGVHAVRLEGQSVDKYLLTLSGRAFVSDYERLRTLEAVYLIAQARGIYHPEHESLVKYIASPNAYGSSQKRKALRIERYLNETLDRLANKSLQVTVAPLSRASGT